jgi:sulfur carrier protein
MGHEAAPAPANADASIVARPMPEMRTGLIYLVSGLHRQFAWVKARWAMQLTVNGESQTFPDGLSVRGLVEALGLTDGPVAVERNREVVPRARHADTILVERDVVEIVHLVGGG